MDKKHYSFQCWVDNLNSLSLIALVLLRVKYPYKKIRYWSISKLAKKFIRIFKANNFVRVERIPGTDLDMTSCEERDIYHDSYRDKSSLAIDIAERLSFGKHLLDNIDSRYSKSKINLFFKQEISLDIKEFLILTNFIKWFHPKDKETKSIRNIIIVKGNAWSRYLKEYKKDFVWKVCAYPDIKKIAQSIFVPIKITIEIVANSLVLFLSARKDKPSFDKLSKIGVLHEHGADLKKKSDYFWFNNSEIDPKRILVYFKYYNWPPVKKTTRLIESYGMQWVNLLPWKFPSLRLFGSAPEFYRLPGKLYIKKSIRSLLLIAKLFFCCFLQPSRVRFWQWRNLANLINRITIYEAFFASYNIKVHYGLYGMGADMLASSIAIESVGGVDMISHWSNFDVQEIATGNQHDVYFSWGPYYKKHFFDKKFYNFNYLVYTGYPYDYLFGICKEKSRTHRLQLLKNGAEFVICFFDQTYPSYWPKTNENIRRIYQTLLNKVIEDPTFGFITKPKKITNFWKRPALRSLANLAQEAQSTGRCLFLDGSAFPNEAAQAADLVIGFGAYSTPTLEAALSGCRAVTCDLQNLSTHPFYSGGFNSIVFNDLEIMIQSIEQFKNNPDSSRLGDYSFILNEIDPFQDRRSSQRVGMLIRWVLDEFSKGCNRGEAVEIAIEKYRKIWGSDKVINFQQDSLSHPQTQPEAMYKA